MNLCFYAVLCDLDFFYVSGFREIMQLGTVDFRKITNTVA
jgi:hypothetical protein